jgi:hypothetical protein
MKELFDRAVERYYRDNAGCIVDQPCRASSEVILQGDRPHKGEIVLRNINGVLAVYSISLTGRLMSGKP